MPAVGHVFISHATSDQEIASQLCVILERNELACWIAPRDIEPAASWPQSIITAIGNSWLMICIASREAYQSRHMAREIERADSNNVPILPVRIDESPLQGELEFFLGNRQWLDLSRRAADDYEAPLLKAVRTAERQSQSPASDDARTSHSRFSRAPASSVPAASTARGIQVVRVEIERLVQTFLAVLAKRQKALDDLGLVDPRTVYFALRFFLYMSLATLLFHVPSWSAQGISLNSPSRLLSFLTDEIVEKLSLCFILHMFMRGVGGKADLRESISAFCFLCAFQPLITISLIPSQLVTSSILRDTPNAAEFMQRLPAEYARISASDLVAMHIAVAVSTTLGLVFSVALFKAYRALHVVGALKAVVAFAAGIAAWMVVVLMLWYPFESNMYKAFGGD